MRNRTRRENQIHRDQRGRMLEDDLDSVKETERERALIKGAQPLPSGLWAPGRTHSINREDVGTRTNVRRAHAAPQSRALPI